MADKAWDAVKARDFLSPTLSRKSILRKHVFEAVGPLPGKRVIEFGSGNGFWLREFQKKGAHCTGIDSSQDQIDLASSYNVDIKYIRHDASTYKAKGKFDVVYIDHVLSETASIGKVVKILKSARALLKKQGRLVINEMHPSVAHFPFDHQTEAGYFYFKSGASVSFRVKQVNGNSFPVRDFHWTLQDFSTSLNSAGFLIEKIIEPRASRASRDEYVKQRSHFPSHLIIKAILK
jgi:2-polyprenyl-3-methyl-5-hydroxy-6-metoxy-1,4-benzoquinol methylase